MNHGESGYGLWTLVLLNSAFFIFLLPAFLSLKRNRIGGRLGCFQPFWLRSLPRCMDFR